MRNISFLFLNLLFCLTLLFSCTKKKDDATPSNQSSGCMLTQESSATPLDSSWRTYNTDGMLITQSKKENGSISTDSIVYTFDSNDNMIKMVISPDIYYTFQYTSGQLSRYDSYISTYHTYFTLEYQPNKITTKIYDSNDILTQLDEVTYTNDNIISTTYSSYQNGVIVSKTEESDFVYDDKISPYYLISKNSPYTIGASKNNVIQYTSTTTTYTNGNADANPVIIHRSFHLTYNDKGMLTSNYSHDVTTESPGVTITYDENANYTYGNCN